MHLISNTSIVRPCRSEQSNDTKKYSCSFERLFQRLFQRLFEKLFQKLSQKVLKKVVDKNKAVKYYNEAVALRATRLTKTRQQQKRQLFFCPLTNE